MPGDAESRVLGLMFVNAILGDSHRCCIQSNHSTPKHDFNLAGHCEAYLRARSAD